MHCPKTPDQITGINADYLSIRKELAEDPERCPVIGIIENRNQHYSIGDIEIAVAGG